MNVFLFLMGGKIDMIRGSCDGHVTKESRFFYHKVVLFDMILPWVPEIAVLACVLYVFINVFAKIRKS